MRQSQQKHLEFKALIEELMFDQPEVFQVIYPELYEKLKEAYGDLCLNTERVIRNIESVEEDAVLFV